MKKRRVGLHGVGPESMRLLSLLAENPDLEWVRFYDEDLARVRDQLAEFTHLEDELRERLATELTDDFESFMGDPVLDVVVDDGRLGSLRDRLGPSPPQGLQIVSPLTARLLWAHGVEPRSRQDELLEVLGEIVSSVDVTVDGKELFARMLEIAVAVTGAAGGSLMLLDDAQHELFIQVAFGVEPELWPKIRVPLGDGIAGKVAADARPLLLSGRADAEHYKIIRERADVASALCVPLIHEGRVLGVLNVHHSTRSDVFDEHDLAFMKQLADLDAAIIERAQAHAALRAQAARYEATSEVHAVLASPAPLPERLRGVCRVVARRLGNGIAQLYLPDDDSGDGLWALAASSLPGGGAGARTGVSPGLGLDGEAARSGQPILLRDEAGHLRYAALPLCYDGRVEGLLAAQVGSEASEPDELEANLLEVAQVVAEGVVRSRREARATTHALRVSAAHESGLRVLACQRQDEVARVASASLAMLVGAEHAIVRLEDPATGRFKIASYFGGADDQAQPAIFALDKAATIETIRRRTSLLVRDLPAHPKLGAWAGALGSMIAAPLKIDGRIVGTVALYDKLTAESFFSGRFNDDDLQIFSHFIGYVERALASLDPAVRHEGLANADDWRQRIEEELARAASRPGALALAICSLEEFDGAESGDSNAWNHAMTMIEAALRKELRSFDMLARLDDRRFGLLLPEPGSDPASHVRELARNVTDRVQRPGGTQPVPRIVLGFGFAANEANEDGAASLEERATHPRILVV